MSVKPARDAMPIILLGARLKELRKQAHLTQQAVADRLGDTGRILVRESGTEPVIRVMVEAETNELCAKYVKQVIDVICAEGLIVID